MWKAKLWQTKLIQAQLNWSSIMSKLNNEKQNSQSWILVAPFNRQQIQTQVKVPRTPRAPRISNLLMKAQYRVHMEVFLLKHHIKCHRCLPLWKPLQAVRQAVRQAVKGQLTVKVKVWYFSRVFLLHQLWKSIITPKVREIISVVKT